MEIRNFRKLFLCRLNEDPLTPQESENIKAKKQEEKKGKNMKRVLLKVTTGTGLKFLSCYAICFGTFVKQTTTQ